MPDLYSELVCASSPQPDEAARIGDVEHAVRDRYAKAAATVEPALCCPAIDYDPDALAHVPKEIIEVDYGCGDPSHHARPGETVLDLGSGSGKICYILSKTVGPDGRVIGVDFNDAMLDLARRHQDAVASRLGHANVSFRKGRIQDLALDLDRVAARLSERPVASVEEFAAFEAECAAWRRDQPMVADDSADLIVSNCVLNLVRTDEKRRLFAEMHRVLRRGGRAVISDIVCDEDPTPEILADAELWSGCIAGAFREDAFLRMFEEAGFHGIEIIERPTAPWRTIAGIEFRSMTVRAFKGKQGPCFERNQAVVYRGPWRHVVDDDGHRLLRGQRMAVCDKTFRLLTNPDGPYAGQVIGIEPREAISVEDAKPFDCSASALRHPRQTKGLDYDATTEGDACCTDGSCC